MTDKSKFWDKIADKYAKRPVSDQAAYEKKLALSQAYFEPNMAVLEFGCGTGSTAIVHAPYVKHIHAIDISSKMLDIAAQRAGAASIENITFEQKGIDDLTVPNESFDVVLGLSILHLLENRAETNQRVFDLLKPGGVFISSTACIADKMKFFRWIVPIGRALGLMPYVDVFSTNELIAELRTSGFSIEEQWKPEKAIAVFLVAKKPDA